MTRCTRCKTGTVLQNYDDVSCLSCGYDPTSPPRAPRPDERPVKGKGVARMVYEAPEPHTGRWWTEGDAA